MHTDPIADMLARIRNAGKSRKPYTDIPMSKVKLELARLLAAEGLIRSHEVVTEGRFPVLRVHLKYDDKKRHAISHLRRISKPGRRVYLPAAEITPVRGGLGIRVISTSQGILTDRDARRRRVGGEVLCEVW